jgi:Mor family transcriptional regulator
MEMLYDTLFPTDPQDDSVRVQAERNAEIIARHGAGETGTSIARAFGISEQRVNQIIRGRRI